MSLHHVTELWGEGASNAGDSRDGGGAASQPGDATWIHTSFPNSRWVMPGGTFDNVADATATTTSDRVTWESPAMVARVQQWADQPATNFGWIVVGVETAIATAKRFDSREHTNTSARPALTIEFNGRP